MDVLAAAALIRKIGARIAEAERTAPMVGARAAAPVQAAFVAKAAPSMRLSGVGSRGARVDVRAFPVKEGAAVSAVGPLHLLERDTGRHVVAARRKRALSYPGLPGPRSSVVHPGTRGRHPFESGYPHAVRVAVHVVEQHMRRAAR